MADLKACQKYAGSPFSEPQDVKLSQQYGGIHAGQWVDLLPRSWVPFVQLCRLSPPAALFIIYSPPLFGVLHAATVHQCSIGEILRVCLVLLGASFFGNNAAHAWNDLVDADIDAKVERTKMRPIPRGAISPEAAFVFTVTQAVALVAVLLMFLPFNATLAALPAVGVAIYYPFAKRHTYFPQVVLGFSLTWSMMVGSSAMGNAQPWVDPSTVFLLTASVLWVVIFDTVYAHQDVQDDIKIGVKSTAVLFQQHTKLMLWVLFAGMSGALIASGYFGNMGLPYYVLTVGGCSCSVGAMIAKVNLKDPASCWLWFSQAFCSTGLAISVGLLADHLLQGDSCLAAIFKPFLQ